MLIEVLLVAPTVDFNNDYQLPVQKAGIFHAKYKE